MNSIRVNGPRITLFLWLAGVSLFAPALASRFTTKLSVRLGVLGGLLVVFSVISFYEFNKMLKKSYEPIRLSREKVEKLRNLVATLQKSQADLDKNLPALKQMLKTQMSLNALQKTP